MFDFFYSIFSIGTILAGEEDKAFSFIFGLKLPLNEPKRDNDSIQQFIS